MTRLAIIAALLAAPAIAATVEDPDNPRVAEGLRVLGMRDQVEVVRLAAPDIGTDAEPLFLARSSDREAVFRAGEDLCLGKPEHGLFVACNRLERRALRPAWLQPVRGSDITVWPKQPAAPESPGIPWHTTVPGYPGWIVPLTPKPPIVPLVPLPGSMWMLLIGAASLPLWRRMARFFDIIAAQRGAAAGKSGWV